MSDKTEQIPELKKASSDELMGTELTGEQLRAISGGLSVGIGVSRRTRDILEINAASFLPADNVSLRL